jgi:hypothetical protein
MNLYRKQTPLSTTQKEDFRKEPSDKKPHEPAKQIYAETIQIKYVQSQQHLSPVSSPNQNKPRHQEREDA